MLRKKFTHKDFRLRLVKYFSLKHEERKELKLQRLPRKIPNCNSINTENKQKHKRLRKRKRKKIKN